MIRIEHIGIAVKDLTISVPLYEKLLNTVCYKKETVATENVNTAFFKIADTKIKLIEKKGEGMHHIAFEVEDISAEIRRLKTEGFIFINEEPKKGADNKLVCFLHPKSTNSILIELCQEIVI